MAPWLVGVAVEVAGAVPELPATSRLLASVTEIA
jgi:hypothetical protein